MVFEHKSNTNYRLLCYENEKRPVRVSCHIIRHRASFPHSSIIAAEELNFCVRNGNRCFLLAMDTETGRARADHLDAHIDAICLNFNVHREIDVSSSEYTSDTHQLLVKTFRRPCGRSHEPNPFLREICLITHKKAMGRLVRFSSIHYCTSTLRLST